MRKGNWGFGAKVFTFALGLFLTASIEAAPYEFANFNLLDASQPFSFTNNSTSANIGVTNAPITFNFTQQTGLSTADNAAFLNIAPITPPSTVVPAVTSGFLLDQPVILAERLTITSGINGTGTNYLTMIFTGDITGFLNGTVGNLSGEDLPTNPLTPPIVIYSSDFGTFGPPGNTFQLGLATIAPGLSIGAGGFLSSFTANIDGQFTSNFTATVPEPSSVALFSLGLVSAAAFITRRRSNG